MNKDEKEKMAFEFALSTTKQLMALATGIIAITVTFSEEFLQKMNGTSKVLAIIGWILFGISIICGQLTLHALTASLTSKNPSIKGDNVNSPASCQMIGFFLGIAVLIAFAIITM